ncbi:hypothetical protein WCQ02_34845 [Paraburkholderia tropica]|uniref:hypothetical protein n=1 Tax=Paraburkholderia tropica TaxID=92647 RepID=UPI0030160619
MGTVEAYNRLCDWAQSLKAKIDAGKAEQQNRLFATDPDCGFDGQLLDVAHADSFGA